MGYTDYSAATYAAASSTRAATGVPDFAYDASGATTTHAELDGKGAVREARDSKAHPLSTPIAIWEDVTGSMSQVPRRLQTHLPQLMGLLLRKAYVTDPQILFAAFGDATAGDNAPLQVGQFESGNEMDEALRKFLLVGCGGGGLEESSQLAFYYMARHTATDAWQKRGAKGYMFIITDERAYSSVSSREVAELIGDTLQENIPLADVVAEVLTQWNVYCIVPGETQHSGDSRVLDFWKELLGSQHVIELADLTAVCETIALTIGLEEGSVAGLDDALADLDDVDASGVKGVVGSALATVGASGGGRAVEVKPLGDLDAPSGNTRL